MDHQSFMESSADRPTLAQSRCLPVTRLSWNHDHRDPAVLAVNTGKINRISW